MATTIIIKNSSVGGRIPDATALQTGELAINLVDQKLYSKDAGGHRLRTGWFGQRRQRTYSPWDGQ